MGDDTGAAELPEPAGTGRPERLIGVAVLVLLPLAIYLRAWSYPLMNFDDGPLYAADLLHGGGWRGLYDVWTGTWFFDYSPVTMLTLWLDLALGDGGWHWHAARVQSALWLGAGAVGVWAALARIVSGRLAFAVAAIYVAHPLCANATLWLAERKNLVCIALTWWCVERYVAWRLGGRRGVGVAAVALGVAALLAKPHAVAIPVMLAAWEATLGPDAAGGFGCAASWRAARAAGVRGVGIVWRRVWPLAAAAVPVAVYTGIEMAYREDFARTFLGGGRLAAVWCDGGILASYLGQVVVPRNLTIYYRVIDDPARVAALAACWAAVAAVVAGTLWLAARRRVVACGWLLGLAALLPALNLVPQAAARTDHYMQWALPGVLLAVAVAVVDAGARLRVTARAGMLAGGGLAVLFALLAAGRVPEFASRATFFTTAWHKQPDCPMNLAGHIDAEIMRHGSFQRPTGALALTAVAAPPDSILIAFRYNVACEAGVEAWRRAAESGHADRADCRAAAWAAVAAARIDEDPDAGAHTWARVLAAIGGPDDLAEADRVLAARVGDDFLAQARALGARCRDGSPLPDGIPMVRASFLRDDDDLLHLRLERFSALRLGLLLAEVRLREGLSITDPVAQRANDESATGLAFLCVNIAPDDAACRHLAAVMYGFLGRDDLARHFSP